MSIDLSFIAKTNQITEVPLRITGTCTGNEALLQKIIILLFSNSDPVVRPYAANFYSLIAKPINKDNKDFYKGQLLIALKQVELLIKNNLKDIKPALIALDLIDFNLVDDKLSITINIKTQQSTNQAILDINLGAAI